MPLGYIESVYRYPCIEYNKRASKISFKILLAESYLLCTVAHLARKKGVCRGRAAYDITFQHKTTLLLRLEIYRWILRCCQSIISAKFCRHTVYRQYLLIKAALRNLTHSENAQKMRCNANHRHCPTHCKPETKTTGAATLVCVCT